MAELITIFGRRGTGKTTLAVKLACEYLRKRDVRCVCLFDPTGSAIRQFQLLYDGAKLKIFWVLNRLEWETLSIEKVKQYRVILLDEVDFLTSPHWMDERVRFLTNYSRHWDIDVIVTARRPARVSRDLTSLATRVMSFKMVEPRDIAYLVDLVGDEARQVAQLEGHEYLEFEL